MLVVAEVALTIVLLATAGLVLETFWAVITKDRGYDSSSTLTLRVTLPETRYAEDASSAQFYERVVEEVA